jgi:beta-N-acetylhexosaminidase
MPPIMAKYCINIYQGFLMRFLACLTLITSLALSPFADAGSNNTPSLREKIGQMLIIGFDGKVARDDSPVVKAIEEDNIGGVILFDYNQPKATFDKNIESPAQVKALNASLQKFTKRANKEKQRPKLPLLISVDYEGGNVNRLQTNYGFPETMPAAEVHTKEVASQLAESMTHTLKKAGFNLNFAPVLDVNVNPDGNPIIGRLKRSFSSDPFDVAYLAGTFSSSFTKGHVQCAYKHFPGHGSATADSHQGFVDVTATWQSYELIPYLQLLNNSDACGMIMTAHVINRQLDSSGLPATLSHEIITHLLRDSLHFDGVVITDDMQMRAISDNFGLDKALELAINAGVDMLIFANQLPRTPQDPKVIIDIIEAKVQSGAIKRERIEEAYRRITKLKEGLK